MDRRTVLGLYGVVVGVSMIALWTFLLATGQIPELREARLQIASHLVAEFLTAVALLAAGLGTIAGRRWAGRGLLVALGMLLYTVINSAGYYAEAGDGAMVGMFALLTATTLGCLWIGLTRPQILRIERNG